MSNSSEWLNEEEFTQEADRCLVNGEATLSTITAYQVAKLLGRKANGTAYKYFRAWKARKESQAAGPPMPVPAEFEGVLSTLLDRFKAECVSNVVGMMGSFMRTADDRANLKVAEEKRGRLDDQAFIDEIIRGWEHEGQQHSAVREKLASTEAELSACRIEIARLEGRTQQMMADRERASKGVDPIGQRNVDR